MIHFCEYIRIYIINDKLLIVNENNNFPATDRDNNTFLSVQHERFTWSKGDPD